MNKFLSFFSFAQPEQPKKRFGLVEAERARTYLGEPGQAQAVIGVVCGVLGYENAIATDVVAAASAQQVRIDGGKNTIGRFTEEIENLKSDIARERERIAHAEARKTELGIIGGMFATPKAAGK